MKKVIGFLSATYLLSSVVVCNFFQMASMVFLPVSRSLVRKINREIANWWWNECVYFTEKIFHATPEFEGDELPKSENAFLILNHQSMADIMALMTIAQRKKRLGDLKWFVKDIIKYFPGVGWGMLFLDCIYVKRNWDQDADKIKKTFSKFKDEEIPIWLISFVEGTRNTPEKLEASQKFAAQRGYYIPQKTLVPRPTGFAATVNGLRDHIHAVYDISIWYPKPVPSLWEFACGSTSRFKIRTIRHGIHTLPTEKEDLSRWLLDRFKEKDEWLLAQEKNGPPV